jgi:ATP:ADP antiporter, AAA family
MNAVLHGVWPVGRVRTGEVERVAVFSLHAFLSLVIYYLLKTMRESILLESGSAELKSYAYAVVALALLLGLPLYGVALRRLEPRSLLRWITAVFAIGLIGFSIAAGAGVDIAFGYYVWVSVLGLVLLTQVWCLAAHVFGVERGERLIPVVMVGAVLGGLVGPVLYAGLSGSLGRSGLMLLASALLVATLPLTARMRPFPGHAEAPKVPRGTATPFSGIVQVFGDRYLLLLAAMAVLMNCVNTTGEYMLADFVVRFADERVAGNPALVREALIGSFYANYYLSINVLTVVVQILLVQKLLQWIGVSGALLVLPVIALAGYGLIAFVPAFGIIRAVKVLENCTDYSLMNTARHALYLPLPCQKQLEGKTIVDTLFWRLGDLAQAGIVFTGLHWAGFGLRQFALLNMLLTFCWILIAIRLGRGYAGHAELEPRMSWRGVRIGLALTAVACVAVVLR